MFRKLPTPSFDEAQQALRANGFELAPAVNGGVLVTKYGAGAVLVANPGGDTAAAFAVRPGIARGKEVARLLDRGYQKFLKTERFEIPATSAHLHAIHAFSEEMDRAIGAVSLYNESLGTTSDLYQYDRLKGREAVHAAAARPWDSSAGH